MQLLPYSFAITPLFNFIVKKSTEAGLHVHCENTKQTLQLFMSDAFVKGGRKRVGAVQYEGCNNYAIKEPHIVSWRFYRALLPSELKEDLEKITSFRRDKNTGPRVNPQAQSIVFKFEALTDDAKEAIEQIASVLKKHVGS
ncbi:MAG: hypothetical protein N3A70_06795 [Anoxybacillus gonensis]|nr:hypothetical protein [Anoxybacillus gonensis]